MNSETNRFSTFLPLGGNYETNIKRKYIFPLFRVFAQKTPYFAYWDESGILPLFFSSDKVVSFANTPTCKLTHIIKTVPRFLLKLYLDSENALPSRGLFSALARLDGIRRVGYFLRLPFAIALARTLFLALARLDGIRRAGYFLHLPFGTALARTLFIALARLDGIRRVGYFLRLPFAIASASRLIAVASSPKTRSSFESFGFFLSSIGW